MTARILIAEDERHLRLALSTFFRTEGYAVELAVDGEEALEKARATPPDCVLLDVMMPKKDGIAVCRELRAERPLLPIILLTAKGAAGDKVLGLDSGADDYVTKPFDIVVLHARVRAQLRRARRSAAAEPDASDPDGFSFGDVRLDTVKRTVTRAGKPVKLSAMQLKVLEYLVAHEGAVVPRNQLLDEVWGYERFPTTRTVDTHMWKLRRLLDDPDQPRHFLTVHGIGYRFVQRAEDDDDELTGS